MACDKCDREAGDGAPSTTRTLGPVWAVAAIAVVAAAVTAVVIWHQATRTEQTRIVKLATDGTWPFDWAEARRRQEQAARQLGLPVETSVDLDGEAAIRMVLIPPGEFVMGSPSTEPGRYREEGPQHCVTLTKGFYLGVYEITQSQWRAVMGDNPSHFQGDDLPVENVSWEDAVAFCRKLSEKEGAEYRLPTEAEWEYACRAGSATRYHSGDSDSDLCDDAWYHANSDRRTQSVGRKKPNAWGLYDMHGNAWEWCQDRYAAYPKHSVTDPLGVALGPDRVFRGGSWQSIARDCRSAYRLWMTLGYRDNAIGFRLAKTATSCP